MGLIKIKKALISVSDKTGIIALAKTLQCYGCEIISTGGTKMALEKAGISVVDITTVTGNPEAFNGRMKTISFNIESALLFDRETDSETAEKFGIKPIDMVVCNLYPFKKFVDAKADSDTLIEHIDIGGPTMIRAGAKNFKYVAVVTDILDYPLIIKELEANNGALCLYTRRDLMRKAFNYTADYDSLIAMTMDELADKKSLRLFFIEGKELRYGENPHQNGFFFREKAAVNSLYDMKVLHGKELSFNNIGDIHSAIASVKHFKSNGCAIIKHSNPCGLCEGENQRQAFELAWAGDPISAFGSIVAFNHTVEKETAEFLNLNHQDKKKRKFIEVIIAPNFSDEALSYLCFHKNLRIVAYNSSVKQCDKDIKYLNGSLLLQDADDKLFSKLEIVTQNKPNVNNDYKKLIEFGINAVKQIKSNAIVVVRKILKAQESYFQLLGMGAAQPNRLISTKLALDKCRENLSKEYNGSSEMREHYIKQEIGKAILISDAFFPFSDNMELCAEAGIKTIIQPGGSIRDKLVIKKCDELGIAMIFTGIRHFKH